MLNKPILARCDNRRIWAKRHPFSGEPEEWIADTYLKPYGLVGLTFDFFVNWRNAGSIPNRLWIKRVVDESFTPWPINQWRDIPGAIYQCDEEEKVKQLCRFADRYGMSCHYFLFKESADFGVRPVPIVEVRFNGNGSVKRVLNVDLSKLKSNIKRLREGPASVGSKGVTYALTSLECYLSKTDTLWPGDVDLVLVDSSFTPRAIIEFKKDTKGYPISGETLSRYYPKKDPRKYDSFAYLRDHLTDGKGNLPIIVLYYSVIQSDDQKVKLEYIEGTAKALRATNSEYVPLPNAGDEGSCRDFVASLLGMIENYEI